MADLDALTLMMAIQAVHAEIARYEQPLESETLRDAADDRSGVVQWLPGRVGTVGERV